MYHVTMPFSWGRFHRNLMNMFSDLFLLRVVMCSRAISLAVGILYHRNVAWMS
jgi:hypothetical protein